MAMTSGAERRRGTNRPLRAAALALLAVLAGLALLLARGALGRSPALQEPRLKKRSAASQPGAGEGAVVSSDAVAPSSAGRSASDSPRFSSICLSLSSSAP